MKNCVLALVVVLAAASVGSAAVVQVDMGLDAATPTVNTMLMTLDFQLGTGSPFAVDTDTVEASGTTKLNLDLTFDPVTHAATVSTIEFVYEAGLSPLTIDDMSFVMVLNPADPDNTTLYSDGVGIGGTLKQGGAGKYNQGPPAAVSGGIFDVADAQTLLDTGEFIMSGPATGFPIPLVADLSAPGDCAALGELATNDGLVSVTVNSIVGPEITYDVAVAIPFDATFTIWNPMTGTKMGYLYSDGDMAMSGQFTTVPEPSTLVGLLTLVLAGLIAWRRRG